MECNFKDKKDRCMLKIQDTIVGSVLGKCDGIGNCALWKKN